MKRINNKACLVIVFIALCIGAYTGYVKAQNVVNPCYQSNITLPVGNIKPFEGFDIDDVVFANFVPISPTDGNDIAGFDHIDGNRFSWAPNASQIGLHTLDITYTFYGSLPDNYTDCPAPQATFIRNPSQPSDSFSPHSLVPSSTITVRTYITVVDVSTPSQAPVISPSTIPYTTSVFNVQFAQVPFANQYKILRASVDNSGHVGVYESVGVVDSEATPVLNQVVNFGTGTYRYKYQACSALNYCKSASMYKEIHIYERPGTLTSFTVNKASVDKNQPFIVSWGTATSDLIPDQQYTSVELQHSRNQSSGFSQVYVGEVNGNYNAGTAGHNHHQQVGMHYYKARVCNRELCSAYSVTVPVRVFEINHPPSIRPVPDLARGETPGALKVERGHTWTYSIQVEDSEQHSITYELIEKPVNMVISATGQITWPTNENSAVLNHVTVKVTDNPGANSVPKSDVRPFFVEVVDPPAEPLTAINWNQSPPSSISISDTFNVGVSATDPDTNINHFKICSSTSATVTSCSEGATLIHNCLATATYSGTRLNCAKSNISFSTATTYYFWAEASDPETEQPLKTAVQAIQVIPLNQDIELETPQVVEDTDPANNRFEYEQGAMLTFRARAKDIDGQITHIEFGLNGASLVGGTVSTPC